MSTSTTATDSTTRVQWVGQLPLYVSTDEAMKFLEDYTQVGEEQLTTMFGETVLERRWMKRMSGEGFLVMVTTQTSLD